jgi:predicted ATPase
VLVAKLSDLVGAEQATSLYPLLNPLLPVKFDETPETAALSNVARMQASIDFFFEILSNLKEKVLICLEDAHWCNELSWTLIERCHAAPDILIVLSTRPVDETDWPVSATKLMSSEGCDRLVLGALEESALREHIARLLEVEEISEQLLKLIESKTGGNLLYIQELVRERASEASAKKAVLEPSRQLTRRN